MDPQTPQDNPLTGYNLPPQKGKVVQPLPGQLGKSDPNPAADLIRQKLGDIYGDEPNAKEEKAEVETIAHRSKHQQFMYDLSHSGKSLAAIQTEWHNYYVGLPDHDKHQIWQEFYSAHGQAQSLPPVPASVKKPHIAAHHPQHKSPPHTDERTVTEIKSQLVGRVGSRSKLKKSDHLKSLFFGLGLGSFVLVIFLFGFFNERFIAPFMTPSRAVSSTPLIIDPASTAVGADPKLIIPKINVEVPVVYDVPNISESAVESGLERGVVHYVTTPNPGEKGNGVIFGHSSNNLFNSGNFKYAFVLLHKLEPGDTFFIENGGKRYTYKIYEKKVVSPKAVEVLNTQDKPSTFTLITCDPPGTSLNRLVIVGEQITPDPAQNAVSHVVADSGAVPTQLPSNSPTLWSRFWKWMSN